MARFFRKLFKRFMRFIKGLAVLGVILSVGAVYVCLFENDQVLVTEAVLSGAAVIVFVIIAIIANKLGGRSPRQSYNNDGEYWDDDNDWDDDGDWGDDGDDD